jgi:hypothetical protein
MFEITIKNKKYYVQKSNRKYKKYDVYDKDDKYITSFGDTRYEHYKDKLGLYSKLDHEDKDRRENYLKRSKGIGNINNPKSANFWSRNILW